MPFWTYMLHCNAGRLYTGHTDDLERRVADHKAGRFEGFTKNWRPVELVWSQEFATRDEAKAAEKRIKGWSRAKKLALIRGDWGEISRLARKKGSPSTSSGQSDFEKKYCPSTSLGRAEVKVASDAIDTMMTSARSAEPHEACGLLLGDGAAIISAQATTNVHPSPQAHFEIDPQALIDAYRAEREGGPQVMGYFHSHPVGEPHPSPTDQAQSARDGKVWAIVAGKRVMFWKDDAEGFHALSYCVIGR